MNNHQYHREWQLIIVGEKEGESFMLEGLRTAFDIKKDISSKPNPAKIRVWNLSLSDINKALNGEFKKLIFAAGYQELNPIFVGDILKSDVTIQGQDHILSFECGDGFNAYKNGRVKLSLQRGANDKQIFEALAPSILDKVKKGPMEFINQRQLPRGKVIEGNSRDLLDNLAINNKADWSVQDGEIVFIPENKVLKNEATLISEETGMIGSPAKTDKGLTVKTLLDPRLKIGGIIKLESLVSFYNGFYKIVKINHKGDSHGNQWESELTVVAGNFKAINDAEKKNE